MKVWFACALALAVATVDEASAFVGPTTSTSTSTPMSTTRLAMADDTTTLSPAKTMGAPTLDLLTNYRGMVDELTKVDADLTEMQALRFALQFNKGKEDDLAKATAAVQERAAWRKGAGKAVCQAAAAAVQAATADGAWNNDPVYASAPYATAINQYITPESVMTLSTENGDLIYVIRASAINDSELMDAVTVEQLSEYFLYAKEIHALVANQRSEAAGRLCNVIFANDISGVRKAPDGRFSKALTSSSDAYEVLYPGLAGPTMILNLPRILQAFVGLLKPLFPKSVQERLVFTKAPVLASLPELSPLAKDPATRQAFVTEVVELLP